MVFWCKGCEIPIIENSICPICGSKGISVSSNGICNPVFRQEKKLLSLILGSDLLDSNLWYLGSSSYLIDGKRVKLPYTDFYKQKKHLLIAEELRSEIVQLLLLGRPDKNRTDGSTVKSGRIGSQFAVRSRKCSYVWICRSGGDYKEFG